MLQQLPELYDLSYQASDHKVAKSVIHNALTVARFSTLRGVVRQE